MRSLRKHTAAMATVAALSLALAACGSDDATDTGAEDTASEQMTSEMGSETTTDAMASEEMTSALSMEPVGPACDQISADGPGSSEGMADDPVATAASNNPLLSTLVTAVGEAGLVETLNGLENATVFAPINSAFDAFSEEELNALLENTDQLTTVLTLHVNGEQSYDLEALGENSPITTVQGGELEIDAENMTVTSPDGTTANIVCGNVQTANATVHLIDTVLMPAS